MVCNPDRQFQSTRPVRGATGAAAFAAADRRNFNPRAPYGARPWLKEHAAEVDDISIHAPRTGRDGGGSSGNAVDTAFQSTRPVRGATDGANERANPSNDFNPRAPYGARRGASCQT